MKVADVIELAREWVASEAEATPGFVGAYLIGSSASLPLDAPFAPHWDVDIGIILEDLAEPTNRSVHYKGAILECSYRPRADYATPETVLANHMLAHNIASGRTLADPTGMLKELQAAVASAFAEQRWVTARCEGEKKFVQIVLDDLAKATMGPETFGRLLVVVSYLANLIIIADLKRPTNRRCLVLMREILRPLDRLDLHERALELLGFAQLSREEVQAYLRECATAFDRAVAVKRSATLRDWKLHDFVKPYFITGSQEMIDAGDYREAMIWICGGYAIAMMTLFQDAPDVEKQQVLLQAGRLLHSLGLGTPAAFAERLQQLQALRDDFFQLADTMVAQHTAIIRN